MTDPEPSDSGYPLPVNRIALIAKYGVADLVGAWFTTPGPGSAGRVVDLDAPDGMIDIVPALTRATRPEFDLLALSRGPIYQTCYKLVREEASAGRTAEEVRALLLPLIEGAG
jgi:hypothetical protein